MGARVWIVAAAGAFTAGAIVLAVRSVVGAGFAPAPRAKAPHPGSASLAASAAEAAAPPFSISPVQDLEVLVTMDNADDVAARVAEKAARAVRDDRSLAALGAEKTDALVRAVGDHMRTYLPGSFERYKDSLQRTNARYALLDDAAGDAEKLEKAWAIIKGVFEANAQTFALKPMSIEGVVTRLRFVDGKNRHQGDDAYFMERSLAKDRYPHIGTDPGSARQTVVELLVPFFYFRPPATQAKAYWSTWFVWDQDSRDWRIVQTALVSPDRIRMSQGPVW